SHNQPASKQSQIEAKLTRAEVNPLFFGGQQVDQQRGQTALVQGLGYKPVAEAVAAASIAMSKQDNTAGFFRYRELAFEFRRIDNDGNQLVFYMREVAHTAGKCSCSLSCSKRRTSSSETWEKSSY